jgi:hypothetical protein
MPLPADFDGKKSFAEFEAKMAAEGEANGFKAEEVTSGDGRREVMYGEDEPLDEIDEENDETVEEDGETVEEDAKPAKKVAEDDEEPAEIKDKADDELTVEQRFQRQQGRLKRKLRKERARAEAAERELEEARHAPSRREEADEDDEEPAQRRTAASDDGDKAPDPKDYKFDELDSDYIRDMARHAARQAFKEERQREEEQVQARTVEERRAVTRSKFEKLIDDGEAEFENFRDVVVLQADKYRLSPDLFELALADKAGHKILHYLATNKSEAARIADLTPAQQGVEYVKLSSRFSPPKQENSDPVLAKAQERKATGAPAPVRRLRGSAPAKKNIGKMSFAEFEAHVNAENTKAR